jgi:hypothetical protein
MAQASAFSSSRGSVLIETLVVVPLYVAIWAGAIKGFEANVQVIDGRRALRTCAWQFAMSGCEGAPAGCPANAGGGLLDPPAGLQAGLARVVGALPFLANLLTEPIPGPLAEVGGAGDAPPSVGSIAMSCNPLPAAITVEEVFAQTCETLGGFCP